MSATTLSRTADAPELQGKFWWPSAEFSTPADNLCWHAPLSPDADFRCVRELGHAGKHQHAWSPTIRDQSHKAPAAIQTDLEAASERAAALGFKWRDGGMRSLARGERERPTVLILRPGDAWFPYSGATTAEALNRGLDAEVKLRDELRILDNCKNCGGVGPYISTEGTRVQCRHGVA